jgi:four helix bundle protein
LPDQVCPYRLTSLKAWRELQTGEGKVSDIAKASSAELRKQIIIGIEVGYIQENIRERWLKEAKEITAMLVGLSRSLKPYD